MNGLVITEEPPTSAAAQKCLKAYMDELARRFDEGFDPGKGNSLGIPEMTPPAGYLLVARIDREPVGCGVLKRLSATDCEVKRVWTSAEVRGRGVAGRIMDKLEALALELGFRAVKLDTIKALTEARAMYARRGYKPIPRYNDNPYAHHWFEKQLG